MLSLFCNENILIIISKKFFTFVKKKSDPPPQHTAEMQTSVDYLT